MKKVALVLLSLLLAAPVFAQQPDALEAYKKGNYQAAIDICAAELQANDKNVESYVVMSWALFAMGKYQESLDKANAGLKVSPYDFRLIEAQGEANFYLGRNLEALKAFEQYTVLAPTGPRIERVYSFMGEIYLQLGEYNHADIALTTAIHFAPTAKLYERLGFARMQAKDYVYAKAAFDEALRLNPDLPEAKRGQGQVAELLARRQ